MIKKMKMRKKERQYVPFFSYTLMIYVPKKQLQNPW